MSRLTRVDIQEIVAAAACEKKERANLRGADLAHVDLKGVDFNRANLYGADLTGANLSEADLSGANLYSANLNDVDLTRANLARANLCGASLEGANLWGAALTRVVAKGVTGRPVALPDRWAVVDKCLVGPGSFLSGANLNGVDLTKANLKGVKLADADLTGAKLLGADLEDADLCRANLIEANLTDANLSGADFAFAKLTGANFTNANLSGADLRGANLEDTDLTGVNFTKADLRGARLPLNALANSAVADEQWDGAKVGPTRITLDRLDELRAAATSADPGKLDACTRARLVGVRMATASNPHASESLLMKLISDRRGEVRKVVLANPACSDEVRVMAVLQ